MQENRLQLKRQQLMIKNGSRRCRLTRQTPAIHEQEVQNDGTKTLDITQQLREKYKAITYNRSDCSYLSDEQFSEAPQVIDALKSVFDQPMNVDTTRKSKAFDSAKVTAHTAIIPTANVPDINALTPDERNVYGDCTTLSRSVHAREIV